MVAVGDRQFKGKYIISNRIVIFKLTGSKKRKIKFEIMYTFIKDYENCEKLSSDNKT